VELSARYIHDRNLPDKAIDVLDEVGASRMLLPENKRRKTITVKDVETVIARMARIPPKTVSRDDKKTLENLDRDLKTMVFGQNKAIAGEEKVVRKGSEALDAYCVNLNQKAADGKIDPLIGREAEIERTIQVLCRRTKNNPLYVGEPGVGKTAIAEGLALRIVKEEVPEVAERARGNRRFDPVHR